MSQLERDIESWLRQLKQSAKQNSLQYTDLDEEAEREGVAITNSLRMSRPNRKKAKVPGWQRFKVKYHAK